MNNGQTIASTTKPGVIGSDTTQRLRVEGGWLYRTVLLEERAVGQMETTVAMCFVALASAA